ncbi:MAG TPA: hypothetical protein VE992_06230 [Solirubrobacteraceae bacterium]|nr:hypothetical protein [Solirubrobacteraceae bacterium]
MGLALAPSGATADAFLPSPGQIFQGVAGQPISEYQQATGKHPAVYQVFSAWGEYLPGMFKDAAAAQARLMIHITTASGTQEMITPAGIAAGQGDAWLISLNNAIFQSGRPTYIRLMAEMDNANNPYCAFGSTGAYRGAGHSPTAYKNAWRRVTLILRGGPVATIDAQLHALGMPPVHASGTLPTPQVAMLWVPMTGGSPDIAGNQPADYWPGRQWVDWVGTDFYSKFPNFTGLNSFYAAFRGLPFVFGEWAMWGGDDPGFVRELFGWVRSHPRVRMMIYNQGVNPVGPFRLSRFPASARALRSLLASPVFSSFTPDWLGQSASQPPPVAHHSHHRRHRRHRRRRHHRRHAVRRAG